MKKDKRFKPRWLAKLKANLLGYFWLPCPICGEDFAGFEWGEGSLMRGDGTGVGVCPNCVEVAKELNEKKKTFNF